MSLLAAVNYDPAVAVTKAASAGLALTALDTTNLRLTFTAPSSGRVLVRLRGVVHGATATPSLLMGVLDGSTVVARIAPSMDAGSLVATGFFVVEATFAASGLTPGASLTWDAAYGVETGVANSALKYGGPNDATVNNAFGAFIYEVWTA